MSEEYKTVQPEGADEFFPSDEHLYAKFEKGRFDEIELSEEARKDIAKLATESIEVNSWPLRTINLFEKLNNWVPCRTQFNTVVEYCVKTGYFKRKPVDPRKDKVYPELTQKDYERLNKKQPWYLPKTRWQRLKEFFEPTLERRATLCRYATFIVKGNIKDYINDEYWTKKMAVWLKGNIDKGICRNWILGVGRLDMSLYDPINETYIVVSKDGKTFYPNGYEAALDIKDQLQANLTGVTPTGRKKQYTLEEVEKFEKRVIYYIYYFLTQKGDNELSKLGADTSRSFREIENALTGCRWSSYEGEVPSTMYDVSEQREEHPALGRPFNAWWNPEETL